jgi:hypothetical protein
VAGHQSALAFGLIGDGDGIPVVVMLGRVSLSDIPLGVLGVQFDPLIQ